MVCLPLIVALMSMLDHSETCNNAPLVEGGVSAGDWSFGGRSSNDDHAINLSDIEAVEFEICETDGNDGLTWNEVQICEEKYAPFVSIPLPTKEDFEYCDTNHDGVLPFVEWQNAVQSEGLM